MNEENQIEQILERVTFRLERQSEILEAINARNASNAARLVEIKDGLKAMTATVEKLEALL